MTQETIYYLGLLGNAHPLLEHINLPPGIRFGQIRYDNLIELLGLLRHVSAFDVAREHLGQNISYPLDGGQFNEMCSIVVTGSFIGELEWAGDDKRLLSKFPNEVFQFENEIVQKIISPTLSLIRLWRACNIQKIADYYYVVDEERPTLISAGYSSKNILTEEYLPLKEEDISILQLFLNAHTLPARTAFVQQALDMFELAYSMTNRGVSLILFMTCLEVLFDAGAHKVARNAAILLGKDESSANSIFTEVKRLHELRSQVVHSGKLTKVKWADVNSLRNVAREAICRLLNANVDKKRFLEELNRFGFADQARVHALLTSS